MAMGRQGDRQGDLMVMGFLPESGGVRSEYQAASRIVTASMLARASAGVR
jgi:hypothetical protein